MNKIIMKMMKAGISTAIMLSLIQCKGDGTIPPPSNLVITTEVSNDGSGLVDIIVDVEQAKYFKFYFGDTKDEIPFQSDFGSLSHTYLVSGTYTITVEAHADETIFISSSKEITVNIFINIPSSGYTTPASYLGMNLIWNDEFNGTSIDETKWAFEIGNGCPNCGWGNNELEYYTKENSLILNGNLVIEAKSESLGGMGYTSSRMITKGKFDFKYGRVDVRAALPKGQGLWPAIWMLGSNIGTVGWPKCGEIDIMEMIGGTGKDNTVYGTPHWWESDAVPHASYGGNYVLSSGIFNSEFHVFSIVWNPSKIIWFMDDIKFHEIDTTPAGLAEFQESFFLILNVAVGGDWPGSPDFATKFPQRMIVDYVRVFQNQ